MGNISSEISLFSPYLALISVVTEDVAQVSKTASSGTNSLHPHSHGYKGDISKGFAGSCSSSAKIGFLQFLQYQTGNGTPKYRCLEMHQSHFKFSTHILYRFFMCSGYQFISSAAFRKRSFSVNTSIYHCFDGINSTPLPQRS